MTEKRGGRPTKERAAAMSDLLLDEARARFARRGVAGTSMEEIAAALGWSKHTLYHRYAGKMALLEAVVARDMALFAQVLIGAGEGHATALGRLEAMARAYFTLSATPSYAALYTAIMLEAASSPDLRQRLMLWSAESLAPLRAAVEAAKPPEGWRVEEDVAAILIDLLDGEANRLKWAEGAADKAVLEAHFRKRWRLFLHATLGEAGAHP